MQNFLFVRGALKLIDFGIAKAIEKEDTTNVYRETLSGTLSYMSPEAIMDTSTNAKGVRVNKCGRVSVCPTKNQNLIICNLHSLISIISLHFSGVRYLVARLHIVPDGVRQDSIRSLPRYPAESVGHHQCQPYY